MEVSDIRYARVDGTRIAYQEFGAGERVVYIPPIVSHIEMKWEHEFHRRILDHMGAHLRVVHFDKRGIGLSDRLDEKPDVESRITDIAAVMDAVGWTRPTSSACPRGPTWRCCSPRTIRSVWRRSWS